MDTGPEASADIHGSKPSASTLDDVRVREETEKSNANASPKKSKDVVKQQQQTTDRSSVSKMASVHSPSDMAKTKIKKRKRSHSRKNNSEQQPPNPNPKKKPKGKKREENDDKTSHNASSSDLLCDVRKIVEAQIRVKQKNAQSTVLGQLDAETLDMFDTTKFIEDSLFDSASKPPPDPVRWQSHPAIMKGARLEHMMELWCFIQTFSNVLGLKTPLTPNQLKAAICKVSTTTQSVSESDDENKRAQVLLDTICISLVNLLMNDLHAVLGFPCDKLGENFPKTLSNYFGINELTWPELARQCIIMHLLREHFNMSSEILGLIRGTPNLEAAANHDDRTTIHLLRQRVECQYSSSQELGGNNGIAVPPELDSILCKVSGHDRNHRNNNNVESEVEEEDSEDDDDDDDSSGGGVPEFNEKRILKKLLHFINEMKNIVRRRCGVVLWWLLEKGAGHHFWSEPDNSKYYDIISQPMCLHTVFSKVVGSVSNGRYDDETLRERFIRDIQLIFENAWCLEDGGDIFDSRATLDLCRIFQRLVLEWLPFEEKNNIYHHPISTTTTTTTASLPPPSQDDDHDVKMPSYPLLPDSIETTTNSEKTTTTGGVLLSSSSPMLHPVTFPDCSSPHSSSPIEQQPDDLLMNSEESVNNNNLEQQQFTDVAAALLAAPFMYMCSECHGGVESDPSVFCYRCEARYHFQCLTPPLEVVPSSAWFCRLCKKGVIWGEANAAYGGQVRHNDLLGRPPGHPMELLCGSGQDGRLSRGECEGDVGMGGLTQWGLFSGIPRYLDWTLNAKVGRLLSVEGETRVLLDALRLLSSRDGGFLPSPSAWTPGERIVVILSLCHAGLRSQSLKEYLSKAEIRCNTLRRSICKQNQKPMNDNNVKSSFINLLKDVGGEQVTLFWERILLSDMNDDLSDRAKQEEYDEKLSSSSKDFCLLCWQSTLLRKTVACSVCHGEVHLSCAMSSNALLETTPFCCSHCRPCKTTKLCQHPTGTTDSFRFLEDPAFLQDRLNREKVFMGAAIDFVMRRSATGPNDKPCSSCRHCGKCSACRARNCRKCSFCKDNPLYGGPGKLTGSCIRRQCNGLMKVDWEETLSNGELCAYCGHAEQALCSSMVVGQTKAEAEWFITNFVVKLSPPSENIHSVPLPYLPLINSKDAHGITGPHVHEVCARLMLKARIEKAQQTMRHLKRRAIKAAVWFSGFYIEPLGVDRAHRVYYRFSGDKSWVYVCCASEEDFNQNNNHITFSLTDWVAYDASEVPRLLKWLNPQGICERKLTQALIEAFPEKAMENESSSSTEQLPQRVVEGSISSVGDDDGGSILLQNYQNEDEEIELNNTEMQQQVCGGGGKEQQQADVIGHHGAAPAPALPKRPEKGNVIYLCEKTGSVLPPTEIVVIHCEVPENEAVMMSDTDGAVEILEDQHYCVKIINDCGNQIQLPQSSMVCFDVLLNGHPIVHKELECPNGDDPYHYYFDAVRFKCMGTFKLNFFLVPGPNITPESAKELLALKVPVASTIVQVTKHYLKTGGAAALKRLRAIKYLRRSSHSCLYGLDFECDKLDGVTFDISEFEVLRLGVKVVATAMPDCALSEVSHDTFMGGFWSPSIREAWITHVRKANRCQHLMEALLLLESCITINWLQPWYKKIIRFMPGVDSLLRLSTPSAVALRLCLLDKALLYDKRPLPPTFAPRIPRGTRSAAASGTTTTTTLEKKSQQQQQPQRKLFVRNTRTSRAANEDGWELFRASDEDEFEDSDSDTSDDNGRSRSKEVNQKMPAAKYKEIKGIGNDGYSKNEDSESFSSNNGSEEEYMDGDFDIPKKSQSKKRTYNKLDDYESSDENDYESSDAYSVSNTESDVEEDSDEQDSEDEFENRGCSCPTCTFLNQNSVTRCTVCNALQPRKTSMNRKKRDKLLH